MEIDINEARHCVFENDNFQEAFEKAIWHG